MDGVAGVSCIVSGSLRTGEGSEVEMMVMVSNACISELSSAVATI